MIIKKVGVVPGTDGQKMSKSYKNTIPVFGTKEEIQKAVMSIVTDSSGGLPLNVYNIHKVVYEALGKSEKDLDALYEEHSGKYKALKDALTDDIDILVASMRTKRDDISDEQVNAILKAGAEKAKAIAGAKMKEVRQSIGIGL